MKMPQDLTLSQLESNLKNQTEMLPNIMPLRANPELLKIKPIYHHDLIAEIPSPIEHILHPWLPEQGIAFIYAATGVGKTLFSLNVAYAIACGGNFLKYKVPCPRKVLYIDGEMAYKQVHSRYTQIVAQQGNLDFPDNFCLLTPDKVYPMRLPKICCPEGQDFYNQIIDREKIEVVVFDNLATLSALDENNTDQWKMIQDWLVSFRPKGISIILVHHSGKDKKGYRGTSRMLDCVDTAISLQDISQNDEESEKIRSRKFKIEYQKSRTFGGQDSLPFEVELTQAGWNFESSEKNNKCRIIEMVNDLGMKPKDIATDIGLSVSFVYRMIKKARQQGLIIS